MSLAVIIPNYNNEKFIRKCLDSVLSQTYQPDEIIVVDDCSKDNSVEIIKEYEAPLPLAPIVIAIKHRGNGVYAQTVDMIFAQKIQGVRD